MVSRKRQTDLFRRNKHLRKLGKRSGKKSKFTPLELWNGEKPAPRVNETAYLKIPEEFSFIADPDEAIATLDQMAASIKDRNVGTIFFDHSDCEVLDLCASAIMDVMFIAGQRTARYRGRRRLSAGGSYSKKNDDVNVLLVSNGIIKNLNIARPRKIPREMRERLRIFPLKPGHRTPPERTSDVETTATKLVEFFNSCLGMEGFQLKPDKESNLMDLIAEVVNNAEEHSGQPKDTQEPNWYAIGYHKRSDIPGHGGDCHIVLFNFGQSIYASLDSPETSELLKAEVLRLVDLHKKAGFFELIGEIAKRIGVYRFQWWKEEALWTLYALQEGVSRLRHSPGGEDRGNGTVRLIEYFMKLASEDPKMVIISGSTWILFDGTHQLGTIRKGEEDRKIIAFNETNDLALPPDPKFVRTLKKPFPGTLVSLKFRLRGEDLAKVAEGLGEDEHR